MSIRVDDRPFAVDEFPFNLTIVECKDGDGAEVYEITISVTILAVERW